MPDHRATNPAYVLADDEINHWITKLDARQQNVVRKLLVLRSLSEHPACNQFIDELTRQLIAMAASSDGAQREMIRDAIVALEARTEGPEGRAPLRERLRPTRSRPGGETGLP